MKLLFDDIRVVWEMVKRRPLVASLPVLIVVLLAFREDFDRWADEARAAVRSC